jgi:hypothetical protein
MNHAAGPSHVLDSAPPSRGDRAYASPVADRQASPAALWVKFWAKALSQGAIQLNSVTGWASAIILLGGVVAGITVPVLLDLPGWLIAVILLGLLILVLAEGAYRVWHEADQARAHAVTERDMAQAEMANRFDTQRHALWFAGMGAFIYQATGAVGFHFELANKSDDPLRYEIESMAITIDGRQASNLQFQNRGEILPPHGSGHYSAPQLLGVHPTWQQGTLALTVRYGHPSSPFRFRARLRFAFKRYTIPELPPGQRNPLILDVLDDPEVEDI